jgi:NADH-quinone oxidoreductase subunit J
MSESIAFYAFSAFAIATSFLVIAQRNPMYSILLLVLSFGAISGLYIQLEAPFIAVTQIIVYAGALMVLFLFVVMLLNAPQEDAAEWDRVHPLRRPGMARWGAVLAVFLVIQLSWALSRAVDFGDAVGSRGDAAVVGSVRSLGRILFTDYLFAFEATSILILVAILGGVYLARRETDE